MTNARNSPMHSNQHLRYGTVYQIDKIDFPIASQLQSGCGMSDEGGAAQQSGRARVIRKYKPSFFSTLFLKCLLPTLGANDHILLDRENGAVAWVNDGTEADFLLLNLR